MPTYRVTVGGQSFEVTSDRELTDVEVYQAAKSQVSETPIETPAALSGFQRAEGIGPPPGVVDRLLNALPMIGGMTGGTIGLAGGTAFGGGFGGVPGAVGGATLGGATGEALRQSGRRLLGGTREVPTSPTEAASDIGIQGAEQGALQLAGEGLMRGVGATGRAVYRGYLKPSLAKNSLAKADTIVRTALEEALPVTKAGATQATRVIKDLRGQVDQILSRTPGQVDLHQVAEQVRAFAKAKYYKPGADLSDFQAAMEVADRLDQHPAIGLPPGARPTRVMVSPTQANETKRALDESVGASNFGAPNASATKTTEKFARRRTRQAIEGLAPEVGPLNAREGRLLDAAKAINRAVGREENKSSLYGVTSLASAAYGGQDYARHGDPYTAAAKALALKLALTPAVATRAAIVAARLGQMSGAVPANVARIAIQAVSETGYQPFERGQDEVHQDQSVGQQR